MIRYYRLITEVDAAVGRLVDELKAQGVYDNTLIVFIGDNGYFHGDRGLADKWYPYEQALRVPLIVRDPRLPRRAAAARRATSLRSTSTLRRRLLPPPACRSRSVMQGQDLSPLYLAGPAARLARRVLLRAPDDHVTRSHSLVARRHPARLEICVLARIRVRATLRSEGGRQEVTNLAGRPAYAERQVGMQQTAGRVAQPGTVRIETSKYPKMSLSGCGRFCDNSRAAMSGAGRCPDVRPGDSFSLRVRFEIEQLHRR